MGTEQIRETTFWQPKHLDSTSFTKAPVVTFLKAPKAAPAASSAAVTPPAKKVDLVRTSTSFQRPGAVSETQKSGESPGNWVPYWQHDLVFFRLWKYMCSLSAGCWWSLTCFRDQVGSRLESQTSMTFAYSSCSVLHPENYEMLKCLFQTERTTGLSGHFYIHTEHHLQYMYNLQNMVNIPDTLFLVFPSYIRVALIPAPSGRGTKKRP